MSEPSLHTRNLLIAALPDAPARNALQTYRQMCQWPEDFQLPNPHRLHMTLFELGEVPVERIPKVRELLRSEVMERTDMLVRLPRTASPVKAVNVKVPATFKAFRKRMGQSLVAAGFTPKGGERPCITLSYTAAASPPERQIPDIAWTACEYVLLWSLLPVPTAPGRHRLIEQFGAVEPAQGRLFD